MFTASPQRTILATLLLLAGCAGYQVGPRSIYAPDIQTVYVPVFQSTSYRRNLGEWLTEAVIKEIEQRTPYKVVGSPDADSVLTGRILFDRKRIIVSDGRDEGRELEVKFFVQVEWLNRRGDILRQMEIPLPPSVVNVNEPAYLVPEVGQSMVTAQQQVIRGLAQQIVNLMEAPW